MAAERLSQLATCRFEEDLAVRQPLVSGDEALGGVLGGVAGMDATVIATPLDATLHLGGSQGP